MEVVPDAVDLGERDPHAVAVRQCFDTSHSGPLGSVVQSHQLPGSGGAGRVYGPGLPVAALDHPWITERDLIEAAFYRELTHVEIAAAFGMPLGSVKTGIRRVLPAPARVGAPLSGVSRCWTVR